MLSNYRNYWIFPSLVVAFLTIALFEQNLWWLAGSCYFLIMICHKKKWGLLPLFISCGFFCWLQVNDQKMLSGDERQNFNGIVKIIPDTFEQNGEQISFDGKLQTGEILRVSYFAKEKEISNWQSIKTRPTLLKVKGNLQAPTFRRNLYGFDQRRYYRAENYYAQLTVKKISQSASRPNLSLRQIRAWLIDHINLHFNGALRVYLNALMTGFRDQDYDELQERLSASGILHLFSISGMHIILFLGVLDYLLRRLGLTKWESLPLLLLGSLILSVILGANPSVLRAILLFLLAKYTRYQADILSGTDRFGIVLLVLLVIDPWVLMKTGGQLSLLMAFLLLVLPSDQHRLANLKLSIWLTIVAAPLLTAYFFEWPLFGGLLTMIYTPIFAVVFLPGSFLLLVFSLLAICPGWLKQDINRLFEIIEWPLHHFEWSAFKVGQLPLVLLVLCLIGSLLLLESRRISKLIPILLALLIPWGYHRLSPVTLVGFVDVGQGDSIVFVAPFKQEVVVIDTGGKMNFGNSKRKITANAKYSLIPFLKGQGITKIDKLILTHGDTDHMGDLPELLVEFKIDTIFFGKGAGSHELVKKTLKQIPKSVKIREVLKGQRLSGYFTFDVLAPSRSGKGENEDSIVLFTKVNDKSFLLTGDLDQAGEKQVMQAFPHLKADVLKIGHHGSKTSTAPEFIEQLGLKEAIISAGRNNRFGHPTPEVLATLKQAQTDIYRTDQQGMIYYQWSWWAKKADIKTMKNH